MIIYTQIPNCRNHKRIIAIFGVGLIGDSICKCIDRQGGYVRKILPFSWDNWRERDRHVNFIFRYLCEFLLLPKDCSSKSEIAFIWSAGKAGFGSSEKEMLNEFNNYNIVLELACRIAELPIAPEIFFHHFSSAGGLFEGQCLMDKGGVPSPKRSYGQIKYEQEKALKNNSFFSVKNIYRPTSVYGSVRKYYRMGLIQTLLLNGIRNRVTTIVGHLNTLRDYILNEDIGKYVYLKMFDESYAGCSIFFLGGGRSSSIYEIKHIVEELIGRKIYLTYKQNVECSNDEDIIISSSIMPEDWYPTALKFGIATIKKEIFLG